MQKNKELDKLNKIYHKLLMAMANHNILQVETSIAAIRELQEGFWENVGTYLDGAQVEVAELRELYTDDQEYTQELLRLLNGKNLPVEINQNVILVGPLELSFKLDEYYLLLSIGRKKQRFSDLEPQKVAKLIEQKYRSINRSFNANTFFKRLLKAYDYINTRMYDCSKPKYGYSVGLKDIYDLFSFSPASADYRLENFLWDLGRLNSIGLTSDTHRFEFGFSRNVKNMLLIKTPSGETMKASTITIYKEVADEQA